MTHSRDSTPGYHDLNHNFFCHDFLVGNILALESEVAVAILLSDKLEPRFSSRSLEAGASENATPKDYESHKPLSTLDAFV